MIWMLSSSHWFTNRRSPHEEAEALSAAALAAALALAVGFQAQAQKPRDEPIQPIEPAKVTDPAKVQLGKKLWFDPRLSRSGFIS